MIWDLNSNLRSKFSKTPFSEITKRQRFSLTDRRVKVGDVYPDAAGDRNRQLHQVQIFDSHSEKRQLAVEITTRGKQYIGFKFSPDQKYFGAVALSFPYNLEKWDLFKDKYPLLI